MSDVDPARASGAPPPVFDSPKAYTLALGDSLGFGHQSARIASDLADGTYVPDSYPGYVVPLEQLVETKTQRDQTVVNYACPGETTDSMIAGPCAFAQTVLGLGYPRALHNDYSGSQLSAAVAFLRAHRGKVAPVTVSIGANDLLALADGCQQDMTCVAQGLPAVLEGLDRRLSRILGGLRTAAPDTEILVLTLYNPIYFVAPGSGALVGQVNAVLAAVARRHRARPVDGFAAINLGIPGDETASLCTFTLLCTAEADIHPSDAGYARLAEAFWLASGYQRLTRHPHAHSHA
ncbi:MAG: SGNH/GDSL hydrolase family protein [Dactylosporangium sp.]|nr:SGNH/GDSL hydrolase family protein [Dactylosporangium sp.]